MVLDLRSISLKSKKEIKRFTDFLNDRDLNFDNEIGYAVILEEDEKIIASGAMSGSVIKCVAVDKNFEGEGLIGKIISYLLLKAHHEGINHLFLYTRPCNARIFSELGFNEIAKVEDTAVLMENTHNGISTYLSSLKELRVSGKKIGSIIMNCNPFTLGHLYLIEKAASENDHVHIFVLEEDRSLFPTSIRIELVKKGTSHLKNITIHSSGEYIISSATFPSYFIKESNRIVDAHGRLDLQIFSRYIAPALLINSRYAGDEPFCVVTSRYNELMEEILPPAGIKHIIVKRMENSKNAISASRVRDLLKENDFKNIEKIVPPSTLEFLKSEAAEPIIKRIKGRDNESS